MQVILDEKERSQLKLRAKRDGMSLSAWIREAALTRMNASSRKPHFKDADDVRAFLASLCEAGVEPDSVEPDWEEHKQVIERSRSDAQTGT